MRPLAWVEVWLAYSEPFFSWRRSENYWWWDEADRWKLMSLGPVASVFEREDMALWPHKVLLGRCEDMPKVIARVAGVSETTAAEALANLGKPIFLGEVCLGDLPTTVMGCCLVVCPV